MSCLEKKWGVRFQKIMRKVAEVSDTSKKLQLSKSCPAFLILDSTPKYPHNSQSNYSLQCSSTSTPNQIPLTS